MGAFKQEENKMALPQLGQNDELHIKDIHELQSFNIANFWNTSIEAAAGQRIYQAFHNLNGIFKTIEPYPFNNKAEIVEVLDVLNTHIRKLKSPDLLTEKDAIEYQNSQLSVEVLLDKFQSEISRACAELGIWLRTHIRYNDPDKVLSDQNFGSTSSFVQEKMKVLQKFSSQDIVNMMSPGAVADVFAKIEWDNYMKKNEKKKGSKNV